MKIRLEIVVPTKPEYLDVEITDEEKQILQEMNDVILPIMVAKKTGGEPPADMQDRVKKYEELKASFHPKLTKYIPPGHQLTNYFWESNDFVEKDRNGQVDTTNGDSSKASHVKF